MVDQRLQVGADGSELARADIQRLARDVSVEAADDRVDEILDGEQLIAVRAVAEDRNPAPLPDPVEQDLEDAEPLRADERLRAHGRELEPALPKRARHGLGLDLGPSVGADTDERITLVDRVALWHAVYRSRRDQHHPPHAGVERRGKKRRRPADVDRANRLARRLDRQRRRRMHEHLGAGDELGRAPPVADVAAQLLDRCFELRVVERGEVERADRVPVGQQPP